MLEGRFNNKKEEFMKLLKTEGSYIEYCEEKGYIYDLVGPIFGCLTKIRLSLKSGRILVHNFQEQK